MHIDNIKKMCRDSINRESETIKIKSFSIKEVLKNVRETATN